ncbi:MAG: BrnT family toxin [Sphingomonadaceae bacterium]
MDGYIEFDSAKDRENTEKHGLSLSEFPVFDSEGIIFEDDRQDYGERRYRAYGRIAGKGYAIVFTHRENRVRMISFRRAHEKEMRRYER